MSHNTVSQLVNSASGIHARHSKYYLRTIRTDKKDPLYHFMKQVGVYHEDDVTKPEYTSIFYFPIKSPDSAVVRDDVSAIQQLELWKVYQLHWCEHKPSVTITVKEHEWMEVGAWVYKNFEIMSGVSFLPYSEHIYAQAVYQEIDETEYLEWVARHPKSVDWDAFSSFEREDNTTGSQELACSAAGGCEI